MNTIASVSNVTSERYALVATVRYLLLVELNSGKVNVLEDARSEYYGVTWRPTGDSLILGHSGTDNASLQDVASYANSEKGWVSEGNRQSPAFLSMPHQILCGSDGRIICTNTGRNCITVIDLNCPGAFHEVRFSSPRWDRLSLDGDTADHLNSVFERDGLLYVLAHAYGKGSFVSVLRYPDLSPCETWPRLRITGLHNICVDATGRAISCHSSAGAVVDVRTGDALWQSGSPVYTRGLAVCKDFVLVGESEVTGRDVRRTSHSGLWMLDRENWSPIDYLSLGPYGAVNEVRLLNIPDEAHHGHVFQGWSSLPEIARSNSIKKHRLQAASAQLQSQRRWRGFSDAFGAYTVDQSGTRHAANDSLCLSTFGEALPLDAPFRFAIQYTLTADAGQSHASIVLGYQGGGKDSNMSAILIQPNGTNASLTYWMHDGVAWQSERSVSVNSLPLASSLEVVSDGIAVDICVEGRLVYRRPVKAVTHGHGRLGVRWIGAGVAPATPMQPVTM